MDVEEPKIWAVEKSQFIILNFRSKLLLFKEVGKIQTTFPDVLAFRILYVTGSANYSGQIFAFAAFSTPYVIMWSQQHGMRASLSGCKLAS